MKNLDFDDKPKDKVFFKKNWKELLYWWPCAIVWILVISIAIAILIQYFV